MIEAVDLVTKLSGFAQDMLWLGFLVFLRIGAAVSLLPAFGEQAVPQRIKLVLALALTAVVAPAVHAEVAVVPIGWSLSMLTEVAAGLLIGIGLRLFVHALQIAAAIIAQATTLSQLFAGTGPDPQPAIGNLLVMAGLALAMKMGLHVHIVEVIILSYDPLPAGQFPGGPDIADWGLYRIAQTFSLAFALGAPFVLASLIYNVAIGIINKAMPALMVSFIGAPALAGGSLLMIAVILPLALGVWVGAIDAYMTTPFAVPR